MKTQYVESLEKYYREKIKPHLVSGNLAKAKTHIANLALEIEFIPLDDIFPYHSGPMCSAKAGYIMKKLRQGELPSETTLIELEAYLAQLKLSTITNNRVQAL